MDVTLGNANNVRGFYAGSVLTLFINVTKGERMFGSCRGSVIGVPFIVDMTLQSFGAHLALEKTIESLAALTNRNLSSSVHWTIDPVKKVLQIGVDVDSPGPVFAQLRSSSFDTVTSLRLHLRVELLPNTIWPPPSTPRQAASKSDILAAQSDAVLDEEPTAGSSRVVEVTDANDPLCSDVNGERVVLQDTFVVDTTNRRDVKLSFYPQRFHGNLFTTECTLYNEVGVEVCIELVRPEDTRLKARHHSGSAVTLEKSVNLVVEYEKDPEECITLHFNSNERHSPIDVEKMLLQAPMSSLKTERAPHLGLPQLVARGIKVRRGRCIIDLTATRSPIQPPTESEVYTAVSRFLRHVEDLEKSLDVESVRRFLYTEYRFMERSAIDDQRSFELLIWSSVRLYILDRLLGKHEPKRVQSLLVA